MNTATRRDEELSLSFQREAAFLFYKAQILSSQPR